MSVLQQSYSFKNGEKLSLSASVDVEQPLQYTIKLTGSDTKPNVLKFDGSSSDVLLKTKKTLTGTVTLREDPLFEDAGILVPPFFKFRKWTQKVTVSVAVRFEPSKTGDKSETASVTRTLEWALRPLFEKNDKDPPKPNPPRPFPPPGPGFDWKKIAIPPVIAALLCHLYYYDLHQILGQLSTDLLSGILEDISTSMGEIQANIYNVLWAESESQKLVEQLLPEIETASQEVQNAEFEVELAENFVKGSEAEITVAEEAFTAAGRLQDAGGTVGGRWWVGWNTHSDIQRKYRFSKIRVRF